ncbi:MAG: secondary thiamine-phosphate synthase enzyme YjbQ [Clostridiales bacterium]|jgi:secondary thiamine-phosphate synthase enzyme|nr:secondary thiamine-phosphate synthase enzyme YjbQ [Clostridiales bacterium]
MLQKIHLLTTGRSEMIKITEQVREAIRQSGALEGLVTVYCPHTTAGITINEGADPDVARDILLHLDELFPWEHPLYQHGEGNSAAHLKASTIGASQAIPVVNGDVSLGTWQAIYFCEFDGPRNRTYLIKVIQG